MNMKNMIKGLKYAVSAALTLGLSMSARAASVEYVTPTYVGGVAANGIAYWTTNTVSTYTVVGTSSSAVTWGVSGATKWYVVKDTVQIDGGVTCAGHVNLILCEGAKLTVTNVADKAAGIMTDVNGSFTVYGQPVAAASPSLPGELYVYGGIGGAAIGGGYRGAGSNITINGGAVTAIGGAKGSSGGSSFNGAAGIGGGHRGSGSNITINGGTVTATGGHFAAGIGGGYANSTDTACGCNITINGGVVDSKGNVRAAGIGGGQYGNGYDIAINGGTVKSTGEKNAAGIGGGYKGAGSNIVIRAGSVTASSVYSAAGIGGGDTGVGSNITISGATVFVSAVVELYKSQLESPDLIGNGPNCSTPSSGIVIDSSARVFFNAVGIWDSDASNWIEEPVPMPESIDGLVIMTPETQTVDRVLVGGCANWTAATAFALTNAATGATGTLAVNDANGTVFANKLLKLPLADGKLTLTAEELPPPVEIFAQPTKIDHATLAVYTNGVLSSEVETGKWAAWSNETAVVVYTAVDGYVFEGGATVVTNAIDTTKNPATADAPVAPFEAVVSVNHNGVTKLYGTIETAWTAVTNLGTKTTPATLTLLTNVTVTAKLIGPVNDDFSAIFDLNDKVITFNEGNGAHIVHQHGKLSVVDNAANKTTKYFVPDADGRWVRTDAVTVRSVKGGYFTGYAWLLMLEGGDVEVRDVSFVGAKRNPVYTQSVTDLTYGKCTFSSVNFLGNVGENDFGGNPGAISLACKEFQYLFEDCVFRENVSWRFGGAIGRVANGEFPAAVLASPPRLVRCVFENNRSLEADGGAVLLEANLRKGQVGAVSYVHPMIFEDCVFAGNEAGGNGGAICAYCNAQVMLKNCVVTNNVASGNGGGISMDGDKLQEGSDPNDKFVLINTTITGNRANANGGGFYFAKGKTCFAAGTKVTMADGTERAIEEVVEGDVVRTFDHEGGKMSSARVYLAFKGEAKDVPFTLEFDGAVAQGRATLPDVVGASVPLARTLSIVGCHDLLEKESRKYVTISAANAHQYIGAEFYGADGAWHKLTGVTRGTQAVDYYSLYAAQHQNVYANGLLTAPDDVDHLLNIYELDENLKADAAQLAADIAQYGLATFEEASTKYGMSRSWYDDASAKYSYVAIGKGLATLEGLEALFAASTGRAVSPLTAVAMPKTAAKGLAALPFAAVSNASPFDGYDIGALTLGTNVIITGNTAGDGPSNVYLKYPKGETTGLSYIALADDHAGIRVGVTTVKSPTESDDVQFTTGTATAGDVAYFTSDEGYSVVFREVALFLNVNPPPTPVEYLAPVYKGTDGNPTNGIAYWTTNTVSTYTVVASSANPVVWGSDGATSWYVVKDGDFQIDGGVICAGHVNLILCEGAKLVVTNETMENPGIATDAYGSFTVYGQPDGAGALESTGAWGGAGIGSGVNGAGKDITINGGKVTATGGNFAAGIGGGMASVGSDISINGGTVTAVGGIKGAGIGGGGQKSGENITINGGTVSAVSTTILSWGYAVGGSGIGGGAEGAGSNITINAGTVTAVGSVVASGIGGGTGRAGEHISIGAAKVFVSGTALRSGGANFCPHVVGNGGKYSGTAAGNVISDEAEVLFNLTPFYDKDAKQWIEEPAAMPADFEGLVIMTPETQTVDRVLVGGCANWTAATAFALTNAITGATGTIAVDGASVVFAERLLKLPTADGMLTLTAKEYSMINPPTEVAYTAAKVYTNGAEAVVGDGLPVTNGMPAYVVYMAANGYCFDAAGTKAITNALDTTKNPATADAPEAPFYAVACAKKTDGGSSVTSYHGAITDAINAIGEGGTGTVTMLADVALVQEGSGTLPNGIDLAFDLAGRKIDWTTTNGDALLYFAPGSVGKLTISDSGSGGTISSTCTSEDKRDSALIVFCDGDGDLTVNGGTFVCSNRVGAATHFFKNGAGTWTFNGGTYRALGEGAGGAHFLYCAAATGTTRITGGTYDIRATASGAAGIGSNADCLDRITITGGDFDITTTGTWGGSFSCGNGSMVVNGGDFSVTSSVEGVYCFLAERGGTTILSNGTFRAETTAGYAYAAGANQAATLTIAGGTYSAKAFKDTAATVVGKEQSTLTLVGSPVINNGATEGTAWNLAVQLWGAKFDFTGYTGANLPSFAVFADGTYGASLVKGDMTKFDSAAIWAGYFSTRPYDWTVQEGRLPFANTNEATKAEYPWVIDDAVTFTPTAVDRTTVSVYTNGATMAQSDSYTLRINTAACVVYTAEGGCCFDAAGTTAITNALDTTKNPATADAPEAPFVPVASVTANGVTTVYGTLAGAWADATTLVKDVDVLVTLLKDATVDATLARGSSGKGLTLDLNDKVLAYAGANDEEIIRQSGGTAMHVIDTATERTPRYFTCDAATGLWTLTNEVTDHVVSGGLLTGGRASALYVTYGGATVSNVNFVGNSSAGSGGAVSVTMGSLAVAESAFFGNVSGENGGAISAVGACEMSDCRAESNVAAGLGGGVYMRLSGSLVRTSVVGNTAGTGGGVYLVFSPSCFPAGVKILMADGTEKNVEDIVEGDVVATFDHVGGTNSSAAVFYVYSGTGSSDAFTLTFASGATLDIVDRHDLLVETTRKYVTVSSGNARTFVGQRFYNYTTGGWDELVGVTPAKGGGAHYSIYVAGHANCVANGFLTVPDDKDCFVNVYELDANLKADAGQLAADIATYGLATPADYPNVPLDDFVDGNIRYARIAIGKGLTTQEEILFWNEYDYGPVIAKKTKGALKLTTSSVAAATLSEPYLKVGEGAVVTGNVTTAGDLSNVYLKSNFGKDPVIHILPDTENLDVGVTLSTGTGVFGFENDVNYAASFTPDDPQYAVFYNAAHQLELVIPVAYTEPVYVDGVASNGIAYWTTNTIYTYTVVKSSASAVTWGTAGATNWYVVKDADVQIDGGVTCQGHVNLILCEGGSLTVDDLGIAVDEAGSFAIYGQPDGAGELIASSPDDDAAGIGGGAFRSGCNITINGGTVTAWGGRYGAGIGCGFGDDGEGGFGGVGSNIVINGGIVTAVGGQSSAGIGGSNESAGRDIVINGGVVTAVGGHEGSSIGGGQFAVGKDIAINGGTVIVRMPSLYEDMIGSGSEADPASGVTISPAANVLFDLTDGGQGLAALPDFEGMVIYTPDPAVARTLVGGIADMGAVTNFVIFKVDQVRPKPIVVNGEAVPFASRTIALTHGANKLAISVGKLPDEPIVKDDKGNDVEIVVPQEWREEKGVANEDAVDPKNPNDNGMPTWQSYALGLDPTNRYSGIYADTPQNTKTDVVTVVTRNLDEQKLVDGFSVKYRLDTMLRGTNEYTKGTTQESASFDVKIDKADPTGVYKLNAIVFSNGVEIAQSAEAVNIVGLIKQTQAVSAAIVSVPWDKLAPGEVGEIAVSNVVKTANLSTNDELRVYRPGKDTYESWILNSNKVWEAATVVTSGAKGGPAQLLKSGEPEAATIPRGSGIWLVRKSNLSEPYYLYGQANGLDDSMVSVTNGPNLVGATGLGAYDLNAHVKGAEPGDTIVVPGTGAAPKVMEFKDGAWGFWDSVPGKTVVIRGVTNTTYQSVWSTNNTVVAPGTGFWLYNKSGRLSVK